MKTKEDLKLKGNLTAILKKADGAVEVRQKDNIIVDAGFDFICASLGGVAQRPNPLSHIAVGTGTAAQAAGQTALAAELKRLAAAYAHEAGTKEFAMTATFGANVATGAITEAGVFNAATGGTMFDRVTFGVINKEADDELTLRFRFVLSQP